MRKSHNIGVNWDIPLKGDKRRGRISGSACRGSRRVSNKESFRRRKRKRKKRNPKGVCTSNTKKKDDKRREEGGNVWEGGGPQVLKRLPKECKRAKPFFGRLIRISGGYILNEEMLSRNSKELKLENGWEAKRKGDLEGEPERKKRPGGSPPSQTRHHEDSEGQQRKAEKKKISLQS